MSDSKADPPLPKGWEDDYQLAFPSDYLGQQHLRGNEVTLTISAIDLPVLEMVKPGMRPQKKRKLVVEFHQLRGRADGTPFRWIVNKTNAATIAGLYGKRARDWIGKRITLWPDPEVTFGTKKIGAIRVRPVVPKQTQQRAAGTAPTTPPPAQELAPPAAGNALPPDDEELEEIMRREREEGR